MTRYISSDRSASLPSVGYYNHPPEKIGSFGHIARLPESSDIRQLLINEVLSSWRRRSRLTWLRMIEQDLSRINLDVISAVHAAKDRSLWRSLTTNCFATYPL